MGFITTGKPLTADHPFFLASSEERDHKFSQSSPANIETDSDSDDDGHDDHAFYDAAEGFDGEQDGYKYEEDLADENHPFFESGAFQEETKSKE